MSRSGWVYIVPAKPLAHAKERLAPALDPAERRGLVLAMLSDVTRAASACGYTRVVCSDAEVARLARACNAEPVGDPTPAAGLNASLGAVLTQAYVEGFEGALIVASDLPCVTPDDLSGLPDAAVVIGPSSDGTGTNVLSLCPPVAIPPAFGSNSRTAHEASARVAGLSVAILERPRLALDVDVPEDLAAARALGPGDATRSVLELLRV